jgi:hypothetical protein
MASDRGERFIECARVFAHFDLADHHVVEGRAEVGQRRTE